MADRTRPIRKEICLNEQEMNLIRQKMAQLGTRNFGVYARKNAAGWVHHQGGLYRAEKAGRRCQPCCRQYQPRLPPYQSDWAIL